MDKYQEFHIELLEQTYNNLIQMPPFNTQSCSTQDQVFLERFSALIEDFKVLKSGYTEQGQDFCCTWVRAYPDLVPVLPRDLLWYFGGDCLHFMPDEEIDTFAQLDERRHDAQSAQQTFDYPKERAKAFNLLH
ncbi:MAG: PA2817 family protein [Pseudomonadales bacterium]